MYKLIFLIFFPLYLISATITINIAKDNNSTFSIIHLNDEAPFLCKKVMNSDFKDEVICSLSKPITKRKEPLENRFFKIYFHANTITITPKNRYNFYSYSTSFITDKNITTSNTKPATHWIVVGYKKENRFFANQDKDALDFDLPISTKELPYIGELNFDLKPVTDHKDAQFITKIKNNYKKEKYQKIIDEVDYFLRDGDNEFTSTAKLYKLRSMDKLIINKHSKSLDPMDLVDLSQNWIDENPSNENLPEVLSFIAKSYIKMSRSKDSDKYLNILSNQYPQNIFTYEAKLYDADKTYDLGDKTKAIKKYKDILYTTKNFDIASQAAIRLSDIYLDQKKIQKAKNFIDKIIDADGNFIKNNPIISYKIAQKFADNNESNQSLKIALILKDKKAHIDNDDLTKDIAYWYDLAGDRERAVKLYNAYLADYKREGNHIEFVKKRLDILTLMKKETNQTKRLLYLDDMIKKYPNNTISHKALLEKADIYLKEKRYNEILSMNESLKKAGGEKLLKEVAKRVMLDNLKDKNCSKAFKLQEDYNLTLPTDQNETLFECFKNLKKYKEAINIAKKMIKSSQLDKKAKWSYELVKLYKKIGNYKSLILVANDLKKLSKLTNTKNYNDVCIDTAQAYYMLKNLDDLMLREVQECEKLLPNDVRLLDNYERVLHYAKRKDDTNLILIYAKKMIDLQERYKLSTYSPKVEIDYIEALRSQKKYAKALKYDLKLLYQKLSDKQRAHILYLAGYLSEKLNKNTEAKEFYTKCGEIVDDSAWVELCSENLELLER
jgi:tetratricopeptide (TPR) repeat protein